MKCSRQDCTSVRDKTVQTGNMYGFVCERSCSALDIRSQSGTLNTRVCRMRRHWSRDYAIQHMQCPPYKPPTALDQRVVVVLLHRVSLRLPSVVSGVDAAFEVQTLPSSAPLARPGQPRCAGERVTSNSEDSRGPSSVSAASALTLVCRGPSRAFSCRGPMSRAVAGRRGPSRAVS